MKFTDLHHANGTYISLIPDAESCTQLEHLQEMYSVPNRLSKDKFHMTLIYSKVPCPATENLSETFTPITAQIQRLSFLPSQTGNQCLVADIESDDAHLLHHSIRENFGASHDYPEYLPHITLSYDCPSSLRILLNPISIRFERMLVKPIEKNWVG